jgi:hypothetical protein
VRRESLATAAALVALVMAVPSQASSRLVAFDEAGGIAGRAVSLTVVETGQVIERRVGRPRITFRIPAERLRKLRAAIRAAPLTGLRRSYAPKPPIVIADGITETVTRRGRSVSVSTGATGVPRRLTRLIDALSVLIR